MVYCTYQGVTFEFVFLSLKIFFILANGVNPDEMPLSVAFHLGFHCLPKHLLPFSDTKRFFGLVWFDSLRQSTIFQSRWDGSSWIKHVLSSG